jgi:uncharacterized circularly permuted ATP-grasp superfamily protein/uncharacterized alpha-E superfamily protein
LDEIREITRRSGAAFEEAMGTAYDEMATGQGTIRPHWRRLMATIWGLPPAQLAERQARGRAHFAEADEFLAIYGNEAERPHWSFDLLPLVLPEAEWRTLADGLVQRARLLDLILADLYGPQQLLAEKLLPPYLVYANPEFLRPVRGLKPAGSAPYLQFYAADLVRMPDGAWRVFNDRTQAAGGVGYALRHRRVLARTFPEAFRATPVLRLAPFLELWQASLQRIGAALRDDPRAVLLTPGPYNDAYFEHVYLARELGITLVQGSDLTVRDDGVYLKALDGLMRVDVIYRRLDGGYCDPLELQEESALGVAGLLGAARRGTVAILNIPGSALIESPAFAPFLPELARRLLREELALPAVTTWWCGQKLALDAVKADLGRFVLRPAFAPDPAPIVAAELTEGDRAALLAELDVRPERFVALERVVHSVVPTLEAEGLTAAPFMLRVAAVWNDGAWTVLPGGVARIVSGDALYRSTLRHGGIAKDVWVLSEERFDVNVPALRARSPAIQRATGALRSRTADDLFWLGRYAERVDTGSRVLRATLDRLAGGGLGPRDMVELGLLARALHRTGWIDAAAAAAPVSGSMFAQSVAAAASGEGMGEILGELRRLAVALRDRLTLDMWHTLNHMHGAVRERLAAGAGDSDVLMQALDELVRSIAAFAGLVSENMIRGAGWHFLDIGRRLERGIGVARAVSGVLSGASAQVEVGLKLALELCDSTITHRTRYPAEPRPASVLDLVLADPSNPRGLLYQLRRLREHLDALAEGGKGAPAVHSTAALAEGVEAFPYARIEVGPDAVDLAPVLALLDHVDQHLANLSDALARNFFSHTLTTSPVGFTVRPRRDKVPV